MSERGTDIQLDRYALEGLREIMASVPGGIGAVVQAFLEDTPKLFGNLRRALAAGDAKGVAAAAHTLKSTSATLGVTALAECCREMEQRGRAGDLAGLAALQAEAEGMFERARPLLQAWQD